MQSALVDARALGSIYVQVSLAFHFFGLILVSWHEPTLKLDVTSDGVPVGIAHNRDSV